jgi:RNA polymerase sigma factor (sigma-70 family)
VADDPFVTAADIALVRAVQRGDTLALGDLLDRLAPYVGRICAAIALDSGPDAAQATLIIVMRSLRNLRDPAALFGWARTIAVREAVRHARRDARVAPTDTDVLAALPAPDDSQLATDVRAVLAGLSPEHRAVLVLRDLHGHDEATTAALLDVPAGTIKSRLHRARRLFRKEWTL